MRPFERTRVLRGQQMPRLLVRLCEISDIVIESCLVRNCGVDMLVRISGKQTESISWALVKADSLNIDVFCSSGWQFSKFFERSNWSFNHRLFITSGGEIMIIRRVVTL